MPKIVPRYLRRMAPGAESRALSIPQLKAIHGLYAGDSLAGVRVTPDSALTFISVYAAVNRLATDVASLPLNVYRQRADRGRDRVPTHPVDRLVYLTPDEETTAKRFRQALLAHVLTHGNGYAEITFDGMGRPSGLYLLDPKGTEPARTPQSKRLYYKLDNGKTLPPYKVLHVAGLGYDGLKGYSPISLARRGVELGLAAEGHGATFFGNGGRPGGVLKHPGKLKPEARTHLRESWQAVHGGVENANRVAILEEGMEWQSVAISNEDAQFLATRQFQRTEVAALFSMPPHKVGDYSQSHLANIEASNLDYLMTTLGPWLIEVEQVMAMRLFTRAEQADGYYVKHNANALLRGNVTARTDHYVRAIEHGWLTVDEVRSKEDLNPIGDSAGGDKHFIPLNLQSLESAGMAPEADDAGDAVGTDDAPRARAANRLNGLAAH
jgi:HK97 family phage portal protein